MFPLRGVLAFVLFFAQRFGRCAEWIPVGSPHLFQNYISSHLRVMRPPAAEPIWVTVPRNPFDVDFGKAKTQTFYRATLEHAERPVYEFRYKVHDPKEENYQEKSETRVGDSVRGYYSVREPNGYVRLVKYVSDENGFKTQVSHHHSDDNGGGSLFTLTRRVT